MMPAVVSITFAETRRNSCGSSIHAYTLELSLQCAHRPFDAPVSCREAPENVQELLMLRQPEPYPWP